MNQRIYKHLPHSDSNMDCQDYKEREYSLRISVMSQDCLLVCFYAADSLCTKLCVFVFCDTSAIESFNYFRLYLNGFLLLSLDCNVPKTYPSSAAQTASLNYNVCPDGNSFCSLEPVCESVLLTEWLEAKDCTLLPTKHPELATSLNAGLRLRFLSCLQRCRCYMHFLVSAFYWRQSWRWFLHVNIHRGSSSLRSITSREEQVSFLEHLRLGGGKLWPVISMRTWNKQIMNQVGETKINSDRSIWTSMAYAVV